MIEIIDLYKNFNSKKGPERSQSKINKGETKVIIGRSGCGKKRIIKAYSRGFASDRGRITVDGQDISKVSSAALNS